MTPVDQPNANSRPMSLEEEVRDLREQLANERKLSQSRYEMIQRFATQPKPDSTSALRNAFVAFDAESPELKQKWSSVLSVPMPEPDPPYQWVPMWEAEKKIREASAAQPKASDCEHWSLGECAKVHPQLDRMAQPKAVAPEPPREFVLRDDELVALNFAIDTLPVSKYVASLARLRNRYLTAATPPVETPLPAAIQDAVDEIREVNANREPL